jgi:hypothetical protein
MAPPAGGHCIAKSQFSTDGIPTILLRPQQHQAAAPVDYFSTGATKPQRRQEAAEDGAGSLTTGKLNAVRAAFKAGVKPSAIGRQFGISQSDVRKALAQGTRR